jgi:hypothetical protein
MAKGRVRSRMELREQYDAAEARERADRKTGGDEDEDLGDLAEDAGDEEAKAPAKKKKKAPAAGTKTRTKVPKVVRKRVVWVVYDNSNKFVAQFPYTDRAKADEMAERLKTEKKQTYFVQPVKEEIKEEKEK